VLGHESEILWNGYDFRIEVTDEADMVLLT